MVEKKPAAKNNPPKFDMRDWQKSLKLYALHYGRQLFSLTGNWDKGRDLLQNNYELGVRHFRLGNITDAIYRLKLVTWLKPQHADAWYYLGRSYLAQGKMLEATTAFKHALKLRPDQAETKYLLAVASGGSVADELAPKSMPLSLAREHFETIAPTFTQQQLEIFQYRGHTLLDEAIRANAQEGRIDHVVLELGVGTGLCGAGLRTITAQLTGVDMSGAMLDQAMLLTDANDKKIYDALIKRELHEFLDEATPESYDIVMAGAVVSYIGDLHKLFSLVTKALKPGGLFAFTADMTATAGFDFDAQAGRFRFGKPYLESLAQANGLNVLTLDEAEVYPNYKMWLCVFKK